MLRTLWMSLLMVIVAYSPISISAEKVNNAEYAGIEITVNVNTAEAAELAALLIGVGAQKAQAIVRYREENGPFLKVSDLALVKGIGPALIDKNLSRIKL
ncbi:MULTISPECIES: helix-hairpin-helix domain-containing protein [Vibrio]|uniref:helix-hairpin-helix domain-containing protein n=1 Tax=Vibrio TaxID=662 RepID=UPI0005FA6062|nr:MULTISPECIES: helix-hairpin-helix domain-containing protein [Vibrio]KJY91133.1 transporter [Vibrio neptunius]MDA0118352.1 helix-hairpin-helix domain-containing protein [Vibrio sp. T11.5]NRB69909.1 helix-hairpin-helix domain-containing protein [Vibrio sp.]